MMMRGGKDEAKVMSPMFPRLHVNDAEKGGPRAPPRNKMALYEQLSIPSQRFNSGSLSMLPFPTTNSSNSVPSISSSHDGDNERSMFMPFGNTPESSNLGEKFHSYHISGINLNTTRGNQERKLSKATDHQSLDATLPIPSSSRSKPSQPVPYSSLKTFSLRKLGHEHGDDLRVPTPVRSGDRNCSYRKQNEGRIIFSKMQLQTANEKEMKETDSAEPEARRSDSIQSNRNKIFADTSSSLSTKIKKSESLKRVHPSSNQENKSSSVLILNSVDGPNPRLHQECVATQDKMIFRANIFVEPGRSRENSSKVRIDSCLRQPLGVENGSPNALENRSKALEGKKSGAIKMGSLGRHNNVPCALMESESPSDIFPDDVVRILGENKFWKVRSAIVNQQRVFAVQVFELHRLIKVQKLIAGSPNMLLEHTIFMGTPSLDVSPMKKLPSDSAPDPPSIVKVKDNSKKINMSIDCADENAVAKVSLPSANDETSKGLVTQRSKYGTYSGNALSTPISANTRTSPWCVSPPGSQWLVPVMSPSEGLVYKPYAGPCPPTAGFMAPVYGSCGPLNLAAGGGEFLNTVYGVPASHQKGIEILPGNPPIGQTYFPHYGMPVMNPSVSSSAVEQMSPFTRVLSKGNRLSTGDVNFTIPHQSSCNMPSQMSQAISYRVGKLPASKDSEIQGSTASSPSERPKGDALPLFPIEPTTQASDHNAETSGQQTRVIKVVPRNPRLATETAARIFQSIQEERKQYD